MSNLKSNLAPCSPVAFALDRTASMQTRDCPGGLTRWEYALNALRTGIAKLTADGHPVTLITYGANTLTVENVTPADLDMLAHGDGSCCIGQAAGDAAYYVFGEVPGALVVIGDGGPDGDTRIGQAFLSLLFARTIGGTPLDFDGGSVCFLTVGEVSAELEAFAARWLEHARLEELMPAIDTSQLEPVEITIEAGLAPAPPETTQEAELDAAAEAAGAAPLPPPAAPPPNDGDQSVLPVPAAEAERSRSMKDTRKRR